MANQDAASYVLRYNNVTGAFEYAVGGNWTPTTLTLQPAGVTFTGSVSFSGTTNAFSPPVLTTTQRNALTPTEGMVIYNVTTHKLDVRTAAAWEEITSS